MANMIEQSLLCKVLDAPDLEILHSNGVIEEMFLTCKDEGDVYPIYLHEMGELEIIQRLVAGILDNKIVVDTNTRINSENDKISIFDLSKKK